MLETSQDQRNNLESARIAYDVDDRLQFESLDMRVREMIETEWATLEWSHNIPFTRVYDETDPGSKSWFYTGWADISKDPNTGGWLQVQLRKRAGGVTEVYTRLADVHQRQVDSESERVMIISSHTASISVKDNEKQGGYRAITPDGADDWASMLSTLEQIKEADFSSLVVV